MKTIIEMAREAGLGDAEGWINEDYDYKNEILAFAALVASAEREACAKVCEEVGVWPSLGPRHCAEAIRERGNT